MNYTFRMHDPRVGRFFAVDPLFRSYPHNSPYAFSENRVIDMIELEGLEKANTKDKETGNCEGCKVIGLEAGDYGSDVQNQIYSATFFEVTEKAFNNLKTRFTTDPGLVNDNSMADYELIDRDGSGSVSVFDHIDINIVGPDNASVVVQKVKSDDSSFSAKFATLEGHTDAGYISFTALYYKDSGALIYTINNTTRTNTDMTILGGPVLARLAQQTQWKIVLANVSSILGVEPRNASATITEYDYNDFTNKMEKKPEFKVVEDITDFIKNYED